jgi:hypothetical protein
MTALLRLVEAGRMSPRTAARLYMLRIDAELARLWVRGLVRAVAGRWR